MNTNATDLLSLADVDAVLPAEFQILQPSDPHHDTPRALRVVHHETTEQTYAFDTPQQYLKFVLSIAPRRLLADVLTHPLHRTFCAVRRRSLVSCQRDPHACSLHPYQCCCTA